MTDGGRTHDVASGERRTGTAGGRVGRASGTPGAALAIAGAAQFMVVLDVSIVNVALPAVRHDLGMDPAGLSWVVNAYAIAFAGFLLLGGRLADLLGQRRALVGGLVAFTVASVVGALAPTSGALLAARAAQGLGAAVLSPATLTVITTTFTDPRARSRALGVWSALAGAGGAAGALLGGVLTEVSWRLVLGVNLPVGALAVVAARLVLPADAAVRERRRLDAVGAVLVTSALSIGVYGVVETRTHAWGSAVVAGALTAAVLLLVLFVVHESRWAREPLVPLAALRSRSIAGANLTMLCLGGAVFASWYFLSLYFQGVLHWSPVRAGLAFVPQTLAIIVGAQVSSRLVSRVGPRRILAVAPLLTAVGLLLLSRLGPHAGYWRDISVPSVLVTLGVGLSFTPVAVAATTGVPRALAGLASGLVTTTRQVGGAVGLAVLATLAATRSAAIGRGPAAETAGYDRAFVVAAGIAVAAALVAWVLPGRPRVSAAARPEPVPVGAAARG